MSKVLTLSQNGYYGTKAKSARAHTLRLGPVSVRVLSVFLLMVVALFYIAQSQAGATKGYEVKQLEEKKAEITTINNELSIKASKLQSIQKIDKKVTHLNLVPTTEYKFLKEE